MARSLLIISLIIFSFVLLLSIWLMFGQSLNVSSPSSHIQFGVSYSQSYAKFLGLDWKENYLNVLNELNVKILRIPTYWREIEPNEGQYNFDDVDFMVDQASAHQAKILLVLGIKQPRWPECQPPTWALRLNLESRQGRTLKAIEEVVKRYQNNPTIWAWQVENEPLFAFGAGCDKPDANFLKQEVDLVKSLDPQKPVVVTDTGEWQTWITPMRISDILGISLYSRAYNPIFGYIKHSFSPSFYSIRSDLVRKYFAPNNKKTIISELQSEPWAKEALNATAVDKQLELFSVSDFADNINVAKGTGFDQAYLWGVEWWYFMKEQGHPEYLNFAKRLF